MKTSKRIISLVLCAVMVLGTFLSLGPVVSFKAEAATTLGGITQQRVVSNYESLYQSYQQRFFLGEQTNEPTNFVIPGLSSSDYYTPQGMTYWEEKEWILISAYDASGSGKHSVIYALDAVTTEFVALFKILNADGSVNTSHGGGIAASEYNFYYADTGSNISYFPLSEMNVTVGTVKEIRLKGSINCGGELGGAATSYCCYEDGVLWAGNFYYSGDDRYKTSAHSASNSMIVGYRLYGDSSAEEWYYLSTNRNLIKLNGENNLGETITSDTIDFKTYNNDGANAEVRGTLKNTSDIGEYTYKFCSMTLTEGRTYKVEFISDNNLSDLYMFAPDGTHCNVKQSVNSTITKLDDGRYHYQMIFTAGLMPEGADSKWPTTQSTNGTYTGTYTMRFDQDSVPAGGRTFNMTDISVTEYVEPQGFSSNSAYEGVGCAGNPTYVVMIPGIDKIQYAMAYKGRIYISRSWKRTSGDNHTRELMVGDIDLNSPGVGQYTVNGRYRPCYELSLSNNTITRFGGDNGASNIDQMFYMGEALCVMDDYLYMFGEGAAYAYNGKESSKCPEPIDVIWKIDQHAIMGEDRTHDDSAAAYYEKVNNLSEINMADDYIIVHESSVKDPVTQKNILYAIDAFGGYGINRLPKQNAGTQANTGDSMGIVGYPITQYSTGTVEGKEVIYVPEDVDTTKSLHWQIVNAGTDNLRINNKDLYYAKYNHLYFGSRLFAMTTDARTNLDKIKLEQYGNEGSGDFRLYYKGDENYYLWCNDGSNQSYIDTYTAFYANHGKTGYVPQYHGVYEAPGTFHTDAEAKKDAANSSNITGESVGADMQIIHIYKRVADPYSSTYDTRVYTDLNAELQADGTYNINLETYAISELQYQQVKEARPTDFIFVLDASGSMSSADCTGYIRYSPSDGNNICVNSFVEDAQTLYCGAKEKDYNDKVYSYQYSNNIYIQFSDGSFHPVYLAVRNNLMKSVWGANATIDKLEQAYWLYYYNNNTKMYYMINNNTIGTTAYTLDGIKNLVNSETGYTAMSTSKDKDNRAGTQLASMEHYRYGTTSRMQVMQNAVNQLTYKIAAEANSSGLDHRIAVVQYGSNNSGSWTNMGMYTNSSTSRVAYTGAGTVSGDNYRKAFHSVSQFGNVRNIINNMSASGDTFVDFGMDMAYNIITHSDANYLADGDRSACVIMITDGCPGFGGNDYTTANTVANAAITNSYNIKHKGAYVYTVQMGNNSMSGFDMNDYMDYLSSEYVYSRSMTNPGDRNIAEIAYRMDVPTGSAFSLDSLVSTVFDSVTSNSKNAMAQLDADSILREQLTSDFVIPDDAEVTFQTAKGAYDGLGRLYFEDPEAVSETSYKTTIDKTNNVITVKGFDYSTKYVSKTNVGKGEKLIVTIKGVIPNKNSETLDNTSINQTSTTAIYQDSTYMGNSSAVKYFPTEHFSVPEYTYYLDYGIPVYDSDINGTLCSVDSDIRRQSTYKTKLEIGNMGIEFTNDKQDMLYTLNSKSGETQSKGYVLIKRDDGTYDWFRLNIVPASTVYYEENKMETLGGTQSFTEWDQKGSFADKYQSISGSGDVFGSDTVYSKSKDQFSLGTHKEVTVSKSANRSNTQTFTFKGTGFDLYSACGNNTGIQTVTVRNASTNELVKVYMVDTYYNDSTYNTLYQVPIVQFKTDILATYKVEVTAAYYSFAGGIKAQSTDTLEIEGTDIEATSAVADIPSTDELFRQVGMDELIGQEVEVIWMDENSIFNGGTGAGNMNITTQGTESAGEKVLINYIDGFRTYNTTDYNSEYDAKEQNSSYYSVIDVIQAGGMGGDSMAAYLEGGATGSVFADYQSSGGPKYEVYLKPGSSIAFRFMANFDGIDLSTNPPRAMVSVRAAYGNAKAKFTNCSTKEAYQGKSWETAELSCSETYYDITDEALGEGDDGSFVLTITNTGEGLLAVDNIKITNAALVPIGDISLASFDMILSTQSVELEAGTFRVEAPESKYPDYTPDVPSVINPDPDLDIEGYIPDYEEYKEQQFEENKLTFFEKVVDFFKTIIERIKEVLQALPVFWTKAK